MLQTNINQQTTIKGLQSQIRDLQAQITTISKTVESLESKIIDKVENMLPSSLDGVSLEEAFDNLQNLSKESLEKAKSHDEAITNLSNELKTKVDFETFDQRCFYNSKSNDDYSEISSTIQSLQKELQRQRTENDKMMERTTKLVEMEIQKFHNEEQMLKDNNQYVTISELNEILSNAKKSNQPLLSDDIDLYDEDNPEISLARLRQSSAKLDKEYQEKRNKINNNMNKLMNMFGESDQYEEEEEQNENESSVFEYNTNNDKQEEIEKEIRDVGIDTNGHIEESNVYKSKLHIESHRRNIKTICKLDKNKAEEENREEMSSRKRLRKKTALSEQERMNLMSTNSQNLRNSNVDEVKLTYRISNIIMNRVESMITDLLSTINSNNVKIDNSDIKTIIKELSHISELKEQITKLKSLVNLKMDKSDAENELNIRITREEFYNMLMTLFPSNPLLQKTCSNIKNKLPPLKGNEKNLNKSLQKQNDLHENGQYTIHQRNVKGSTQPAQLVPARNSRLLALNQKFLKGADGKYYLRDIGNEIENINENVNEENAAMEQVIDYQPFLPKNDVINHNRAKTPIQSVD
ncbi:hypothetical protein GPJ56_008582 [Histomonas meleagridis]|uniref:uncharacterized protein n=1 Tax=Histomonas meleagridis TaxID=135588 RepID=UPI003559F482|nr:hypothetical protein GPJ56_008582 [Histomonas meleagridis]KAH0805841.1 hypothetical protein GO595_001480 [Histomonas meleagridis]